MPGTQFSIGAWFHYILPPYIREREKERERERKTRIDNRDSPIVDVAQLATDSRGRRRVEGQNDQCLLGKLRKYTYREEKRKMSMESISAKRAKREGAEAELTFVGHRESIPGPQLSPLSRQTLNPKATITSVIRRIKQT